MSNNGLIRVRPFVITSSMGGPQDVERIIWKAHARDARAPWVAVAIADGNVQRRRDVTGGTVSR